MGFSCVIRVKMLHIFCCETHMYSPFLKITAYYFVSFSEAPGGEIPHYFMQSHFSCRLLHSRVGFLVGAVGCWSTRYVFLCEYLQNFKYPFLCYIQSSQHVDAISMDFFIIREEDHGQLDTFFLTLLANSVNLLFLILWHICF